MVHQTPFAVQSLSHVWLCNPVHCNTSDSPVFHHLLEFAQTHVHSVSDAIQPSHPLLSSSPPALNPSQHQGLFQWVSFLHQAAKVLELQHQSFQWIFRVDFLYNWLVWSPCCQRHFQESSLAHVQSINSSALGLLYSPTLTSLHFFQSNYRLNSSAGLYWGGIKGGPFRNQNMCQRQACVSVYRDSF